MGESDQTALRRTLRRTLGVEDRMRSQTLT
jgi:hypothetical protein